MDSAKYIGLDVHKESIAYFQLRRVAAYVHGTDGELRPLISWSGGVDVKTHRMQDILKPAKPILGWAFLTCLSLGSLAAGSVRADTISGETITFKDLTDGKPIVDEAGGSRFNCTLNIEFASCTLTAPTNASYQSNDISPTGKPGDGKFLVEPGPSPVPGENAISDLLTWEGANTNPNTGPIAASFLFQSDSGVALGGCPADLQKFPQCFFFEDGTAQKVGTITWFDGTNFIVDTIQIQSDVNEPPEPTSTVPEPGTLVLFGSGLVSVIGFARRKILTRASISASTILGRKS
jgi:hypothetical protein